jgi:hypothetical protein
MAMHKYFANWYSVAKPEPKSEIVDNRWAAIENYTKSVDNPDAFELVRLFYARPVKQSTFIESFRNAFKETDSAFLMRDNDLEIRILAGATIANILDQKPSSKSDATALATVSGAYQSLRPQILLPDIVKYARDYLTKESLRVREIENVPDLSITPPISRDAVKTLKTALGGNSLDSSPESLTSLLEKLSNTVVDLAESVDQSNRTLLDNYKIQQEETNILWWLFGEHSRDQERHIRKVDFPGVCLVIGKELADLTILLPGPRPASAFLDKMLRTAKIDPPESIKLIDAVNSSSREWKTKWIGEKDFHIVDDLCPVHLAASKSLETSKSNDWISAFESATGLKARKTIHPLNLSLQTYEEALLIQIAN